MYSLDSELCGRDHSMGPLISDLYTLFEEKPCSDWRRLYVHFFTAQRDLSRASLQRSGIQAQSCLSSAALLPAGSFSPIFITNDYASSRKPVHMLSTLWSRFLCLPPFAFTYIQLRLNVHYISGHVIHKSVLASVPLLCSGLGIPFPIPFRSCSDTTSSLRLFLTIQPDVTSLLTGT